MGWKTRLRGENLYHHIYAWGNDRHSVFKDSRHYQKYLLLIAKHARAFNMDIIAYALKIIEDNWGQILTLYISR